MDKKIENIRHSCAHLVAAAVKQIWPHAKNAIGPAIEDGFYQDFDMGDVKLSEDDFEKIEKKMHEILKTWNAFQVKEVSVTQAKKDFANNPYKLELIDEFAKEGKKITENDPGNFLDLCKGGHSEDPKKELANYKLLKIAGAYWRGNEKNKMLTRIYGTAFPTKKELDEYLYMLEEAKKRDHRKIGKELDLISFSELSPGAPFFHPKGAIIYKELMQFLREEYAKRGYQEVITPLLYEKELWETSGHWSHYKENMFILHIDNKEYALKAMNCPSHCIIYKTGTKSYRDLPLRITDFAPLHRNELRGVLGGLTRVRKFSQDDGHTFCTPEQIEQEIENEIAFVNDIYGKIFKMEYVIEIGTRPKEFLGEKKVWDKAEQTLMNLLKKRKITYAVNEGEGAFYGPKIDLHVKDSLKRSWQLATIQLDFQLPQRFNLEYTAEDGKIKTPVMIHRAMLGSLERFIGVLIEHFGGKFPTWLAPIQVALITVADRHKEYADQLAENMKQQGIRVTIDARQESISKKVRDNQAQHIPYVITIGNKEIETNNLAIRDRENKVITEEKETFVERLVKEIKEKT